MACRPGLLPVVEFGLVEELAADRGSVLVACPQGRCDCEPAELTPPTGLLRARLALTAWRLLDG
ncbi:hypothetical protein [Streptomyces chattanoogensis]|uniref:hypothetical protein n=1 Tax=Streptomyces chattanoogensis TaxID=66876 RepID=UPI000B225AED|nr:hypothetical protein [Streptomyces chattanoogensis]